MAESRPVPCNLLSWPRVVGLLPDQKLVVVYLWMNRFTSSCGCYQLPIPMASVELGLSENALAAALIDFERKMLVLFDQKTAEIFVLDWFRFHKFATSSQNRQLDMAVSKIESESLKNAVLNKINVLLPNRNLNFNFNKSLCARDKKEKAASSPQQIGQFFKNLPQQNSAS